MQIKIIYETQTGTTQYVAEQMQEMLQQGGHSVELHSIRAKGNEPNFNGMDLLIFGAPTYEDGKIETAMKVFITRCKADLSKSKVAVFGLGNSSFPKFCTSAAILEEWVKERGGSLVIPPLKVDGFPDDLSPIQKWVTELSATVQK